MDIIIQNHAAIHINEEAMLGMAAKVLTYLKPYIPKSKDSLTLVFVTSAKMQVLNSTYRHKDYVTDVLSFSGEESDLGELVFCDTKLQEQAKQNNHSKELEFLYLLIHGILHLCGYDHEKSPEEAQAMFKIQDTAFEDLNTLDTVLF